MPGIWLSDDELRSSAGAIWLQQQQQRVQTGQDWAGQQVARLQQQAAQQVAQLAPSPVAPPPPAPPPTAPPVAPVPTPAPVAPSPVVPIGGTPVATPTPSPGDLTGIAPPAPAPAPQTPTVPTPAPAETPSVAEVGQNWAQQQIANLLNPSTPTPASTPTVPTPAPQPIPGLSTPPSSGTSLPDQSQTQGGVSAGTPTPLPQTPPATQASAPDRSMSLQDYARAAAQRAGIDPNVFTAQIQQESGFNPSAKSPAGAVGVAQFMPGTAAGVNLDPTDPYASLDAAAKMDAQNLSKYQGDWNKTLAAYNAGGGNVDKYGGVPPFEETQRYVQTIMGNAQQAAQNAGTTISSGIDTAKQAAQNVLTTGQTAVNNAVQAAQGAVARTSQFALGLSSGDAMAFCGPAAAMAFADTYGRNPTVAEAKQLAQSVGWNPDQGMAGAQSEVKLLNAMGVDAHMTNGVDWASVGRDASGGNPVIIDTPGHYYYVDGYNQQTGQLHVGTSGTDLKGGSEWMTPDQINKMPQSGGGARAAIFADHPLAQQNGLAQSTATVNQSGNQNFMGGLQDAAGNALANAPLPFIGSSANQLGDLLNLNQQQLQQGRDLVGSILSPDPNAPAPLRAKADSILQSVQDVGGQATQASQNLLQQGQQVLQGAQQVPQTVNDLLNQNALFSQGIPNIGGNPLTDITQPLTDAYSGLSQANQQNQQWLLEHPDVAALGGLTNQPIDTSKSLGPQLTGIDPYGQIVQGIPRIAGGIQQGNLGDVLGGGLQTLLGAASALPGGGGAEAATRPAVAAALDSALRPGDVPWSQTSLDLLEQGPSTQAALPSILNQLDISAQARALGVSPDVLTGAFDELGRRIPSGALENPLTSGELGRPSYDQYGVFQRDPALYSERGVAMDPATGQEIVPPSEGELDWRTPMPSSSVLEGLEQMARERGLDPTAPMLSQRLQDLAAQVSSSIGTPMRNFLTGEGSQSGSINTAFARALGGGAAGGLGAYQTTDPNDPNRWLKVAAATGGGALAAGPGVDLAMHGSPSGISAGDWLKGLYRGGIISAPSTMLDVAGTSTVMPVIQTLAGLGRDLATLQPGRAAARMQGTLTGLQDWIPTFLNALSVAHANPGSLVARAGTLPEQIAAYGAEGAGMLHGAFQDATQNLIRQQELATGATPAAAEGVGARAAGGQNLGTLTSWLGRAATGGGPITDALFPIYKKGMQLASRMVEFSPLGAAGSAIDVARGLVGQGPYAAGLGSTPVNNAVGPLSERLVNNAIGTGLSILLAHQALEGNITGSWEGLTPAQQDALRGQGQMPDGFQVGGTWHSWDKLPPALRGPFMAAGAYADAQHAYDVAQAKQGSSGPQAYGVEDPREAAAVALMREVGGQLVNQTPLRGFSNTYDALTGGGGAGSLYNAPVDMLSNVLGGLVPESAIVRTAAQATDPYQRQPLRPEIASQVLPAILQNVQQNIPGVRQQLPTRLDVLGRDILNPQQGLGAILPMRAAAGQPSSVLAAMGSAGAAPSGAPPSIPYGPSAQINLTPAEQQQYERYRGQMIQQMSDNLVTSPDFKQMPDYAQRIALQRVTQTAGEVAGRMLLGDLAPQAQNRLTATGVFAPVQPYGPNPLDQATMLRNQASHRALIQALLSQQAS